MFACYSKEVSIPFEEFGFEPGFLEFSKEKYHYDSSTDNYYMYFANEYFDSIDIWFSSDNTVSILSIELSKFFYPDEHGKSKFSQVSEILKSFYGNYFEVEIIKEGEFAHRKLYKQIWKINRNIIELRSRDSSPLYAPSMFLKITFHPKADLRILE